jgi:hypothetical protein
VGGLFLTSLFDSQFHFKCERLFSRHLSCHFTGKKEQSPHPGIERGHLSATPMAGKFVRNEIPPPARASVEFSTG